MDNLILLLPEIILCATAVLILSLDMAWGRDPGRQPALPYIAIIGCILTIVAAFWIWIQGAAGAIDLKVIATDADGRIPMLAADQFAVFFKIYAALTALLVSLVAGDYVRKRVRYQGEFYALTLLTALALMFLAASTNLVMIFLAFEYLSISSYILVGFLRGDQKSVEGSLKYFIYGAVSGAVMLYGFTFLYGATGSLDLRAIAEAFFEADSQLTALVVTPAIILIVVGLGFKIALVPFHQWAPEAYQGAPTPITAFLSVGPKAAGFAVMARIMILAFPGAAGSWFAILTGVAIMTMTLGNLVAMWQNDLKRLFAYSSIAQAGYMLIGVVALNPGYLFDPAGGGSVWNDGLNGLLIYLFAYLMTNIGVFSVIIAVEMKTGSTEMEAYAGLLRRAPFLAVAMLIFLLSLVGIPPTAGFIGKFFVLGAAIKQGMFLLAIIGIVNSVISVYYYFKVARQMFFADPEDDSPIAVSTPLSFSVALTTVLVLLIAIWAQPFIDWTTTSAQILASTF